MVFIFCSQWKKNIHWQKKLHGIFYDDEQDTPEEPSPFGIAGWFKNDASVLIYDKTTSGKLIRKIKLQRGDILME